MANICLTEYVQVFLISYRQVTEEDGIVAEHESHGDCLDYFSPFNAPGGPCTCRCPGGEVKPCS